MDDRGKRVDSRRSAAGNTATLAAADLAAHAATATAGAADTHIVTATAAAETAKTAVVPTIQVMAQRKRCRPNSFDKLLGDDELLHIFNGLLQRGDEDTFISFALTEWAYSLTALSRDKRNTRPEQATWTSKETNALVELQMSHGSNWGIIASALGRSAPSVRNRWLRIRRGLNS